ncbi:MAG: PAS domain S-box protein [Chitinophagaceae bacterium]|nr:MAG: PAS domain S-box protein [Chitinophagaceae bacterium]
MSHSTADKPDEAPARTVHLYLPPRLLKLAGDWSWEGGSPAMWCSNVLLSFPAAFAGTRGLLHPDDAPRVEAALAALPEEGAVSSLEFRIIDTWGAVRPLSGKGLRLAAPDPEAMVPDPAGSSETLAAARAAALESDRFRQRFAAAEWAERRSGSGSCYANASNHEVHYSDNVFRLHGLQPQSLNAHLRTFLAFVHPDDALPVEEAFDSAWRRRLPIELLYRIITPAGEQRFLRLCTTWQFSREGGHVLLGVFQDETASQHNEREREELHARSSVLQEASRLVERQAAVASWQYNLLTRKWSLSENFYRLLGVRPSELSVKADPIRLFLHPDDRERVESVLETMERTQECPDLDYRILRPDGQVRHLQLRGRSFVSSRSELLIIGSVRDLSLTRALERREARLVLEVARHEEVARTAEELGGICTWTFDPVHNRSAWSEGCYRLLGYKANSLELTQKLFLSFLHPDDRKSFLDTRDAVQQVHGSASLLLRLLVQGETRYVQARFRMLTGDAGPYLVAAFRDDTLLRQQQEVTAGSEALFSALLAALPEKIFVTDAQHLLLQLNAAAAAGLPVPAEGRNLFDLWPRLQGGDFPACLQRAFGGEACSVEGRGTGSHLLVPVRAGGDPAVLHVLRERPAESTLQERLAVQEHLVAAIAEAVSQAPFQ